MNDDVARFKFAAIVLRHRYQDSDERYILMGQRSFGLKDPLTNQMYSTVVGGGKIEMDEDIATAAIREVYEETHGILDLRGRLKEDAFYHYAGRTYDGYFAILDITDKEREALNVDVLINGYKEAMNVKDRTRTEFMDFEWISETQLLYGILNDKAVGKKGWPIYPPLVRAFADLCKNNIFDINPFPYYMFSDIRE